MISRIFLHYHDSIGYNLTTSSFKAKAERSCGSVSFDQLILALCRQSRTFLLWSTTILVYVSGAIFRAFILIGLIMPSHPASSIEELHSLFAWCPPPLKIDPAYKHYTHLETESSLRATFYDMHLAPDMICKRVIQVKNLHKTLAAIVDNKLQTIQESGVVLPPPDGIEPTSSRDKVMREVENLMKDELSVVEFYGKTTTRYCVRIASSLALHPTIWSSLLHWSSAPCCGAKDIPGGSLQVLTPRIPTELDEESNWVNMRDFVDNDSWTKLMEVKYKYQDLATWRMMNPSLDDTELMLGIMGTADNGEFEWKLPAPVISEAPSNARPASSSPPRACDAAETTSLLTSFPTSPASHLSTNLEEILDGSLRREGSSLKAVRNDRLASRTIRAWSDDSTDASLSTTPPTRTLTSRALIQEVGSSSLPVQTLLICHIQCWGQSVRQNTTVLVVHSGNLEYICFRHRASQTLYISDILHVPQLRDPGYGKVQVGLYIAALTDAFQRLALDGSETSSAGDFVDAAAPQPEVQRTPDQISGEPSKTSNQRNFSKGVIGSPIVGEGSTDHEVDTDVSGLPKTSYLI
jgi:hypothetical protein